MRPRKRVAVIEGNEVSRRIRAFVLDLWGYAVFPVRDAKAAGRLLDALRMDVVIAVLPGDVEWRMLKRCRKESSFRVLSLDPRAGSAGSGAEVSLSFKAAPIELRECIRILALRKRGPKMRRRA